MNFGAAGAGLLRSRRASKRLRRRSGLRRSALSLQTVQGGRWGGVVRQDGGHFQPAGAPVAGRAGLDVRPPLEQQQQRRRLESGGVAVPAPARRGRTEAAGVRSGSSDGRPPSGVGLPYAVDAHREDRGRDVGHLAVGHLTGMHGGVEQQLLLGVLKARLHLPRGIGPARVRVAGSQAPVLLA